MTTEWQEQQNERALEQKQNPITGQCHFFEKLERKESGIKKFRKLILEDSGGILIDVN